MQTAIAIVIVAVTAFLLIRRFLNNFRKKESATCGCGCTGCGPVQKENCSETESSSQ